jgi:hypothetical protein
VPAIAGDTAVVNVAARALDKAPALNEIDAPVKALSMALVKGPVLEAAPIPVRLTVVVEPLVSTAVYGPAQCVTSIDPKSAIDPPSQNGVPQCDMSRVSKSDNVTAI